MSLTVVCATLLAAIGCRQLRNENPGKGLNELKVILEESAGMKHASKGVKIPTQAPVFGSVSEARPIFQTLASLAPEAVQSSVWCTCETSGRNSCSLDFLQCSACRISCCSSCIGSHTGYQMKSHDVKAMKLSSKEHHMGHFLSKLRNVAPASVVFDEGGIAFLAGLNSDVHRVVDLHKFQFNLQKVQRERRKWILHYNARDNNGVGEVVAEFRIAIGELWTQAQSDACKPELGMKGELISYFPAKTAPLVSGPLEPCAVIIVKHDSSEKVDWRAREEPTALSLEITGKDPEPSIRVEMGLTDKAAANLRVASFKGPQKKHFQSAQKRGEDRRWLYPTNWKEWPSTLEIKSKDLTMLNGVFKRVSCRQTANQSAIWMRCSENDRPALYIIIKPNVGRTGPDSAVISSSISFTDFSAVVVTLLSTWQPCDALVEEHVKQGAEKTTWIAAPALRCYVPNSAIRVETEPSLLSFLAVRGLSKGQVNMLHPFDSKDKNIVRLNVHSGVESQKITRSFNYLCVPPIMRHAAKSSTLSRELSPEAEWKTLAQEVGEPRFGYSEEVIPPRPVETWGYDDEREVWTRKSSPEESREYYRRLQEAKKAFDFILNKAEGNLAIKCYPDVAAHHATRFLVDGRGDLLMADDIVVSYRLSDISLQSDPEYSPFKVFPCRNESPTAVSLKPPYCLYERQQKVVTKMSLIESGDVSFDELEMAEHEMPGSTGFSLIAKASRKRKISGGVIADAIGAGKTVISIALILQGLEEARASRSYPRKSGASLVVVPSALVGQWKSEIEKFTNGLRVLCIHDTKGLEATSVEQIIESDVCIVPVDIIESKGYTTKNLATKSGLTKESFTIPNLPKSMGHAEKPGAKGVWIPATSRDPYGMGSANEMKVGYPVAHLKSTFPKHHSPDSSLPPVVVESKASRTFSVLYSFLSQIGPQTPRERIQKDRQGSSVGIL